MDKENEYADIGIDYSIGMTNIDKETGKRYGIIPSYEISQAWCNSSQPYYPDDSDDESVPDYWGIDDEEYKAYQNAEDADIFIIKSPFYTICQFCSPCAPGAGYIMNTVKNGVKAYCFGHDWFDSGEAPYPVYDMKTDELVISKP